MSEVHPPGVRPTIARIWRGRVRAERADEYEAYYMDALPALERWTYFHRGRDDKQGGDQHVQLDYVLLSPALAKVNPSPPVEIIRRGLELGVDYGLTTSCYDVTPDGACGQCDSCLLRLKGFAEAGVDDPVQYRTATMP